MNLESVLLLIGAQLALDGNELIRYANEDVLGGYHNIPSLSKWEGGSMWESEGRMIYALVRALKPAVIVELGGYIGCSASHMAAAVMMNGVGKVYSLDNGRAGATHGRAIPENLRHLVQLVNADGLEWLEAQDDNSIDFLLEDMMHDTPSVKVIAELAMQKLKPGGLLVNHDAMKDFAWADQNRNKLSSSVGAEVREGLRQAHVDFRGYITDESDCGLSIAQKPTVITSVFEGLDKHITGGYVNNTAMYRVGESSPVVEGKLAEVRVTSEKEVVPGITLISSGILELRDQMEQSDTEPPKPEPKKRGRKPKAAKE